ncbi:MAG: prepilin peptidase [Gemmatimonadota bacterium]|nr:prepilin peptidase [Gemmatimonadota bacterium]
MIFNIFAFILGACIGSFLNVCIGRWPAGMSIVRPPSRCPACERPIRAYENVPILGWLALRGRCAGCAGDISPQYPLVELLIALVWLASAYLFGPTFLAIRVAVFVTLMTGIAITDAQHYIIPDGFTLFGVAWLLVAAFTATFLHSDSAFAAPYDAIMGAMVGAGAIAIAGWLGEVALKREAMGFGDVTLMAVVGAALGPQRALLTIFIGAALGVVIFIGFVLPATRMRARTVPTGGTPATDDIASDSGGTDSIAAEGLHAASMPLVPFGVFLAPSAIIALFYGTTLVSWYAGRFLSS